MKIKVANRFFKLAFLGSWPISLIKLCAVQSFDNYLAAVWNFHISCYLYVTDGLFSKTMISDLYF